MLRLLLTILAVYLVLLLLQSSVCRGVNGAIMGGYWWMCGDAASANAKSPAGGLLQQLQQAWNATKQHYDYFPPSGLRLPMEQGYYIFTHWCWKGIL